MQQEPKYFKGGGGSSTTSTSLDPAIRDAILPAIERASNLYTAGELEKVADTGETEQAYRQGMGAAEDYKTKLGNLQSVAAEIGDLSGKYGEGRTEARAVGQEMLQGLDEGAMQRMMTNTRGNLLQQAAGAGGLTSARAQRSMDSAMADKALALQQADLAQKGQGATALMSLGTQAQQAGRQGMQDIAGMAGQAIEADRAKVQAAQGIRALQQEQYDAPLKAASAYGGFLSAAPQATESTTKNSGGK
jgi:hypothetical protein